jgi:hypothetical protein
MKHLPLLALAAACLLCACALPREWKADPQPPAGPTAVVADSYVGAGRYRYDLFYISQINGVLVETSFASTGRRNAGVLRQHQGKPDAIYRLVSAERPLTLVVEARPFFSSWLPALSAKAEEVSGTVEFTPRTDATYTVKGFIGEKYAAVWVEDDKTNEVVGRKIEKGSLPVHTDNAQTK